MSRWDHLLRGGTARVALLSRVGACRPVAGVVRRCKCNPNRRSSASFLLMLARRAFSYAERPSESAEGALRFLAAAEDMVLPLHTVSVAVVRVLLSLGEILFPPIDVAPSRALEGIINCESVCKN